MNMPQDPILLMSLANTYLRDQYSSPEVLCEDREWDLEAMIETLHKAGFDYMPDQNQFR